MGATARAPGRVIPMCALSGGSGGLLIRFDLCLRVAKLKEDDGEEEVDDEEASDHHDHHKVDPDHRGEGGHQIVHWRGPVVKRDGLNKGDKDQSDRVE